MNNFVLLFMQKTAYDMATLLEFRRVLFRSTRPCTDTRKHEYMTPVIFGPVQLCNHKCDQSESSCHCYICSGGGRPGHQAQNIHKSDRHKNAKKIRDEFFKSEERRVGKGGKMDVVN